VYPVQSRKLLVVQFLPDDPIRTGLATILSAGVQLIVSDLQEDALGREPPDGGFNDSEIESTRVDGLGSGGVFREQQAKTTHGLIGEGSPRRKTIPSRHDARASTARVLVFLNRKRSGTGINIGVR
jgi:hypothetical protein